MGSRFVRLRLNRYADYLEELLTKHDPDFLVTIGNRGPQIIGSILADHPRLAAFRSRLFHINATKFMGHELANRTVLLLDDTAFHGTSLLRAKEQLERLSARVIPAAFSVCDDPELRKLRAEKHIPHFDVLEKLSQHEYAELVSDISDFIRSRGPVTAADITRIRMRVRRGSLSRELPLLLGIACRFGDLSEHRYAEHGGGVLSFSLHWPTFFDPGELGEMGGLNFDGIIKIRLRVNLATDEVDVIPMVHATVTERALIDMFARPSQLDDLELMRTAYRSHLSTLLDDEIPVVTYDMIGFYLDLRLAQQFLSQLSNEGFSWSSVELPTEDLYRYYGPGLTDDLGAVVRKFLPEAERQKSLFQSTSPTSSRESSALDEQPAAFPALMTDILRRLRKTYRRWDLSPNTSPTEDHPPLEPTGYSFTALLAKLNQGRLWTSEFLDYLCDAMLLSPLNQLSVAKDGTRSIERAYRAGEDKPPDLDAICAWVIWYFRPGADGKSAVPPMVAEKSLVALADVFHLFEMEPRIDTHRHLHGKRPSFQEEAVFLRPRLFSLDTLPSQLYKRVSEPRDGYLITERFEKLRDAGKLPLDIDFRCRLEDSLDRLKKLYQLPGRAENLVLLTMLASRAFGLDDVAADIELSTRHVNEALLEMAAAGEGALFRGRRALGRANEASGIAGTKVRLLERGSELVAAAARHLNANSTAEKLLLDSMVHLPPGDSLVDQIRELRLLWRQALGTLRNAVSEKPNPPAQQLFEALRQLDRRLSRVMNRERYEAELGDDAEFWCVQHIAGLIGTWCATLGNARHLIHKRRDILERHNSVLVVDVTGFVEASLKNAPEHFASAIVFVMNVLEGWLRVFGVSDHVYGREGDKLIVGFPTAPSALLAGACMMHHVRRLRSAGMITFGNPEACLKIGIDCGLVDTLPSEDAVSRAINVAARLCDHARNVTSNILVTRDTRRFLDAESLRWLADDDRAYPLTSGGKAVGQIHASSLRPGLALESLTKTLVEVREECEAVFKAPDKMP